ncbi:MAG: hypothetical protein WDW38_007255 [Sanguina aurantia]
MHRTLGQASHRLAASRPLSRTSPSTPPPTHAAHIPPSPSTHHSAAALERRKCAGQARAWGQKEPAPLPPAQQDDSRLAPAVHFDLQLGVTLAGAAFEAYLLPTGSTGLQQRSFNGSQITFTDKAFLSEAYKGILRVQLKSATELRPADVTGASDPYAVLSVGSSVGRSRVVNASLNPTWDEVFWLYVRDPESEMLKVRLWDSDFLKSDDDLGNAMMPIARLLETVNTATPVELTLRDPGAGRGKVQLSVTYLPFSGGATSPTCRSQKLPVAPSRPPQTRRGPVARGCTAAIRPGFSDSLFRVAQSSSNPASIPQLTLQSNSALTDAAIAEGKDLPKGGEMSILSALQSIPESIQAAVGSNRTQEQSPPGASTDSSAAVATQPPPNADKDGSASALEKLIGLRDQLARTVEGLKAQAAAGGGSSGSGSPAAATAAVVAAGEDGGVAPNPWTVLAKLVGRGTGHAATAVAYIDHEETDTQVRWKDVVTDINLTPSSLNPERSDSNEGLPFTMRLLKAVLPTTEVMVHKGFLTAYDAVRKQVVGLLDQITSSPGETGWKVYVTGHSLGGALATLCAYELACRQDTNHGVSHISMYTYGAPRVGNKAFAALFNEKVPDSWRVTNSNDIIPSIPRLMGYCHVKHSVSLGADGGLLVEEERSGRDFFGEGKGGRRSFNGWWTRYRER